MTNTLTADEIKNITRFVIYNLYVKTHYYLHPKENCDMYTIIECWKGIIL